MEQKHFNWIESRASSHAWSPLHLKKRRTRFGRSNRGHGSTGAVILEMAACLPVMLLLVFGCLELNSSIFLSQTLTSAAHEGALVGLRQNATEADVLSRVGTIMDARNITGYSLELKTFGTHFDDLQSGQQFANALQAPRSNQFISLSQVGVEVTALRP